MTYAVYERPGGRLLFTTNSKNAARRAARWRTHTVIMGVEAGAIVGQAFYAYGARVEVQGAPPPDISRLWLERARSRGFIELPGGPRIWRRWAAMRTQAA